MEDVENPRIPHWSEKEICAHTEFDISGREWICINEPHVFIMPDRTDRSGVMHYMVNRWPYRNKSD